MTTAAKVAAVVTGSAALGAGVALLLAPQSGPETRKQIRHYAKRVQVQATRMSRSMKAGFDRAVEKGKLFQENRRPVEAA